MVRMCQEIPFEHLFGVEHVCAIPWWIRSQWIALDAIGPCWGDLSLRSNNFTGSIPKSLGKLKNLKAQRCKGDREQFGIFTWAIQVFKFNSWPRRQELYIDHNQLTGEIPLELGDLPQLRSLYLDHNQLQVPTLSIEAVRDWMKSGIVLG